MALHGALDANAEKVLHHIASLGGAFPENYLARLADDLSMTQAEIEKAIADLHNAGMIEPMQNGEGKVH